MPPVDVPLEKIRFLQTSRKDKWWLQPALTVLETALFECESDACHFSSFHGFGHLQDVHPERVAAVVDRFLDANPKLQKELRIYAKNARIGMVQ